MKKLTCYIILAVLLFSAADLYAGEILVSAAISLKGVFGEIVSEFHKQHPDDKALMNYASSGKLMKQIEHGAQADVFASASKDEVDTLVSKGLIKKSSVRIFAENSLAVVSYQNLKSLNDLANDDIKMIAIGNKITVPAGRYAKSALEHHKLYDKLKDKFVYAENARQVLDYVKRGEVDAGIVYKSDTKLAEGIKVLDIDRYSHEMILYPIGAVVSTRDEALANRFIEFVTSARAAAVLKRFGFTIPEPK